MNQMYYDPTDEHLVKLSGDWCCSYSGGKDSTSLVTWIEWLRRSGQIHVDRPQLIQSNTAVEDPVLNSISSDMMEHLRACGWECAVVTPAIHEKLYNRILGIGNIPIHPGITRMRWCTRSTKIDPMERWRKVHSSGLCVTGLRLGESAMRDSKIKKRGCAAGGECGIPEANEATYSPLLTWRTCDVIEWLNGAVERKVAESMAPLYPLTRRLVEIYEVVIRHDGFEWAEPEVSAARFGCTGCPAISATREPPRSTRIRNGEGSPLNELYDVWFEARRRHNRCYAPGHKNKKDLGGFGPIRLAVRKHLFDRVLDIQHRSGVMLITPEDEVFIRDCWANKIYPRGWSEEDETTVAPTRTPLFDYGDESREPLPGQAGLPWEATP